MKITAAALVLVLACSCAMFARNPDVDDNAIRDEIHHYLEADDFATVTVTVSHGIVTLTGHLPTSTFREKAGSDAERASGVRRVINNIVVP